MAYTSEIDKLEARFRDNPKGRNFAPLADAYRKAGLIDNAIDLCQNGLKLHPDYVSAYIVYARCLVDKKDDPAAVAVFTKVLELDGENIIALRGLAELAERNGRYDEEVEWLGRLLNADPMNGDAAEALARAKGKAGKTMDTAPTRLMTKADVQIEHEDREVTQTALSGNPSGRPSTDAPLVEKTEDAISFNPGAHAAAKAEGLEVQQEVELSPKDVERVEVEGLARTHYEGSGMFRLDAPAPASREHDEALPKVELPLIMPEEPAPTGGAGAGARAKQTPAPPKPPAPPSPPAPPASSRLPAAVALSDDDGAADTATLSRAEPVLTETMAELYLKQGHEQDALRVYQALLAQRPNDARLRSKVEQLSPGGKKRSGVSARGFLKSILSGRGGGGAASAATPQSTLAAAFDVAGPGGTLGEPSHPAQDTISLDSVFGEDAARRAPAAGTSGRGGAGAGGTGRTGGTGAGQPAAPAADATKTGGFSFDEFFAGGKPAHAEPAGAESKPGATSADAPPKTPGRTSGRNQRPAEDEADADQFQQWLKKLKS